MKQAIRTFLCIALATLAAAQGTVDDGVCRYVATVDPGELGDGEAAKLVRDLRAELAEIRVKFLSGRAAELGDWEARLNEIWLSACSERRLPEQRELLIDVAVTRARAYATSGRFAEARAAVEHLLIPNEAVLARTTSRELQQASPALVALAVDAASDPRVAEVRVDLSLTQDVERAPDELDAQIREAIVDYRWDLVLQLGTRALPALEEAVLAGIAEFPEDVSDDPFYVMLKISGRRAAAFALEHLASGGYVFRRRVLRAMDRGGDGVLANRNEVWGAKPSEFEPRPCLVPEWPRVLAALLADRELAREAMPPLGGMIAADGVTPEVVAALRVALGRDPELVSDLLRELEGASRGGQGTQRIESAKGIYDLLLESGDASVRRFAASELLAFPSNEALWARAGDDDALVRKAAAQSLKTRRVGNVGTIRPPTTAGAIAALRALLRDELEDVRGPAAEALVELEQPLAPEVYRALLDDPSATVRLALTRLRHPDEDLMRDVLERLAGDPSADVRAHIDSLFDTRLDGPDPLAPDAVVIPAARVRLLDPGMNGNARATVIRELADTDAGLRAVMDCVIDSPHDALRRQAFELSGYFRSSTGRSLKALGALAPEKVTALMRRLARDDFDAFHQALGQLESFPAAWDAALVVMRDERAPAKSRFFAAQIAASRGGAAYREAFVELVAAEPAVARSEAESGAFDQTAARVPERERNAFVLAVLSSDGAPVEVGYRLAAGYRPQMPDGEAISRHVVADWLDDSATRAAQTAMDVALHHLATLPDALSPETLERAARHPLFSASALEVIRQTQDPRYLPLLEDALTPTWAQEETAVARTAVHVLGSFPDEEATRILLDAMVSSPSAMVRQESADALQWRKKRLEQRDEWLHASERRLTESDAIARLIAMLKDPDPVVRVESARGLATLRAVAALPALIEALRDDDADVVRAVRASLDRLNALAGAEDAPGDE